MKGRRYSWPLIDTWTRTATGFWASARTLRREMVEWYPHRETLTVSNHMLSRYSLKGIQAWLDIVYCAPLGSLQHVISLHEYYAAISDQRGLVSGYSPLHTCFSHHLSAVCERGDPYQEQDGRGCVHHGKSRSPPFLKRFRIVSILETQTLAFVCRNSVKGNTRGLGSGT